MTTLFELTKARLAYATEKYGADGPIARQLQTQLDVLAEDGNAKSAHHARPLDTGKIKGQQ